MARALLNVRKDASQGGSAIGRMVPVVAMVTNLGTIASVKADYVYIGTTNPRAVKTQYLHVTETEAITEGWPNNATDIENKHNQTSTVAAHS